MTGVDLLVAASRPRGIADALAVNLAIQITRNEALEARCAGQDAQITRLTEERDGLLTANESMYADLRSAVRRARIAEAELREAQR